VKPLRWLEIIIGYTLLTLAITYLVPANLDSPLIFLRYIFGFIFVSFLPGYCLVNVLFLSKNELDIVEEVVLSVALSFGLVGLAGLFLGLSPIGINFTSITVSLSAIVFVLAVTAFIRKSRGLPRLHVKRSEQVSA
jgi:uncharacterized membrane protein